MQGIFINYRRQDSQSAAGRLADHIKENMVGVPVFRDVETIEPGVDFIEAINRALESCGVLLAVIGPHWVSLTDAAGRRRLDNPNDYTRLEITTALKRNDVRVIPVLVEGAQMPEPDDLPEDLQALCRRNAIELTDKRWNFDVSQLIEALRKVLDIAPPRPDPQPQPPPQPAPAPAPVQPAWYQRLSKKQWGGIAAVVVVLGILGEEEPSPGGADPPPPMPANLDVPPAPVQSAPMQPPAVQPSAINPVTNTPAPVQTLAGGWQDAEGGRYQLIEQGSGRYRLEGQSPYGPVVGEGKIANNILVLAYVINGVQYGAYLEISADGNWLRGQYGNGATNEVGMVVLQRIS